MENIFTWKWEEDINGKKYFGIYKDNCLFGRLPNLDLDFTGVAEINKHYFYLQTEGSFFKKRTYILDARTKKNLGQVILYSDNSYHLEVDQKSKYKLTKGWYFNDKYFTEISYDKVKIFKVPKSGTIKIYSDSDIELLIYCGFYAKVLHDAE